MERYRTATCSTGAWVESYGNDELAFSFECDSLLNATYLASVLNRLSASLAQAEADRNLLGRLVDSAGLRVTNEELSAIERYRISQPPNTPPMVGEE